MRQVERTLSLAVALALLLLPAPRPVEASDYRIGVGDVLDVTVWQRETLGGEVVVDVDGNITLPLIGQMKATDQTPARLGDELTRRFSFVDRGVSQVTVAVKEYNSRRVFVMGAVMTPGSYAFAEVPGVWDVIREAGGPSPEASLSRVRVIPPAGEGPPSVIDLERVLATGDFSTLPDLQPGTTILIPRGETFSPEGDLIHVFGQVTTPGSFPFDGARTVVQAVLAAGGPIDGANLGSVRVIRPGPIQARVFELDLEDYTEDGELYANMPLQPGDTVTIPKNKRGKFLRDFGDFLLGSGGLIIGAIVLITSIDNNTGTNVTVEAPQ